HTVYSGTSATAYYCSAAHPPPFLGRLLCARAARSLSRQVSSGLNGKLLMKIAFVGNNVMTEKASYTTTRLAMAAVNLGHESFLLAVGEFIYALDGSIHAHVRSANGGTYESLEEYLESVQHEDNVSQQISLDDLD